MKYGVTPDIYEIPASVARFAFTVCLICFKTTHKLTGEWTPSIRNRGLHNRHNRPRSRCCGNQYSSDSITKLVQAQERPAPH